MSSIARFLAALIVLLASPVFAQNAPSPGADIFSEGLVAPDLSTVIVPPSQSLPTPDVAPTDTQQILQTAPSERPGPRHSLVLEARLVADGKPVTNGLIWRIFGAKPADNGQLPLIAETPSGGTATVQLAPGDYLVHAAFGRAGATKRVAINDKDQRESLVLDAGGLKLDSVVGDGRPIPPDQLSFEVLQADESGDLVTVVPNAAPDRILRLSAGNYHVVSRYGNVNAIVRADITVEAGKLTEATLRHNGAAVTLKLVSEEGGEALANTSWTVTTQDGITVNESVGAFPTLVLAAGSYTAVAKHQDELYSRDFTVESGIEREVEVRLSDLVQPETGPAIPQSSGGEPMEP